MSYIENIPNLSGVSVNQNQKPTASIAADGLWRYQEFFLPSNFKRGSSDSEVVIPALSGWQLLAGVTDVALASFDWKLEYYAFGIGWQTLIEGTSTGSHAGGDKVWIDVYFDKAVVIPDELLDARFHFGFKINAGINKTWYTTPNPFAANFAKAYQADGVTAIQSGGQDAALCFRVLSLSADEGTDFLGNTYRSAVAVSNLDDISRLNGNPDAGWMSAPLPSRFATTSLYFDVRPSQPDQYEVGYTEENKITNPKALNNVAGWSFVGGGGETISKAITLQGTPPAGFTTGFQGTPSSTNTRWHYSAGIPVVAGDIVRFAGWVTDAVGFTGDIHFRLAKNDFSVVNNTTITNPAQGAWFWGEVQFVATATETLNVYLHTDVAGGGIQWTGMILTKNGQALLTSPTDYFDGDTSGARWTGTANASISRNGPDIATLSQDPLDVGSVIDKILLDPLTPGVYFNAYYSNEGAPGTDDSDWDNKLWTHVPRTYHAVRRESHVLPEPITAKYIKIEFCHLQAQSYNPGDLPRPVSYKKHPKWVLDYFLARTAAQKAADDTLLPGTVSVIYDALDLAYNYYLDDLAQEPDKPVEIDSNFTAQVNQFVQDKSDFSDQVDAVTLAKINLALTPYQNHPAFFSKDDYLLGAYSKQTAEFLNYPTETTTSAIDFPDVQELRSESVIFESDFPVMFFYLTCRHKYREVVAEFSHNRAYFAGVREIAFTRERFSIANDASEYQEPGGDLVNTTRNDFTRVDDQMVIQ